MFCTKCGAKIDGDAGFCSECGNPVTAYAGGGPMPGPVKDDRTEKNSFLQGPGKWLVLALAVLVVVVIVLVVVLVMKRSDSDKARSRSETDIERDREEEDDKRNEKEEDGKRDDEEEDHREIESEGSGENQGEVEKAAPTEEETAVPVDPSVWIEGYANWLKAYGKDENVSISLVAIDGDTIPECLVWWDNDWDSELYVLSYRESGIAEYLSGGRDIWFECQEQSGCFACMTYSGLTISWFITELSDSGFADIGEITSGPDPQTNDYNYYIGNQEVDYAAYLQCIAGFTGNIEITNLEGNKNRYWVSCDDCEKSLEDAYAKWSIGEFRENDGYWKDHS